MNEQESLERFGLRPATEQLPEIRRLLLMELEKEESSQGLGDTALMKLCCIQLFACGELEDILLVWRSKRASMDAAGAIDVQLLCGRGLDATKTCLAQRGEADAAEALQYIRECEECGDFDGFSRDDLLGFYAAYYGDGEP